MSKPRNRSHAALLAAVLVTAASLLAAGYSLKKQAHIDWRAETPLMADLRGQNPSGSLDFDELTASPLPAEEDAGPILYGAVYYPDAQTVVCTVSIPNGKLSGAAPYLVRYDHRPIEGRWLPGEDRYGIRKLYFEEVPVPRFGWLDLVDAGALGDAEYDPYGDSPPKRVRFLLDEEYASPKHLEE